VRNNQLRIGIHPDKNVLVANSGQAFVANDVSLLLENVSPDFVHLNMP
jgi:hypothetical protein